MSLPTDVSHATQRAMRSTGKHPKIQQRWASTEYDDEPSSSGYASAPPRAPQQASVRRANTTVNNYEDNSDDDERRPLARARPPAAAPDDDEPPLFSSRRLALECAILLFILSWLAALGVLFASRYEECRGAQASHYGRFVNIASASGALSWTVGRDGVLGTTRHHPANATFLVEYRGGDKSWFCLRALPELRVVEAVPPRGGPQEWMLRLGRIGCTGAAEQLFQYRGRSMYSKGVDGYVNLRDWQHLRVHGDRMPWTPMRKESRMTRVSVEVVGETAAEAVAVNERLLALVSNFDADAQRSTAVPG